MKTAVTKNVAMSPRQAKTTAAMGSGSPHRRYSTGIGSQPGERRNVIMWKYISWHRIHKDSGLYVWCKRVTRDYKTQVEQYGGF